MNYSKKLGEKLGRVGVWSGELRGGDPAERAEAIAEVEAVGYRAIWIPGGGAADFLDIVDALLTASRSAVIATGIINVWRVGAPQVVAWWKQLPPEHRTRLLLGLGISHGPMIGADYSRPVTTMKAYLDGLDAGGPPAEHRCLAALAPKMLELARDRTAGSHPYLVPPEHTAIARERLGPNALLAPEQTVVLETDPGRAREIARSALGVYLKLPNYVNNWRRLGFSEEDVTTPSDRLIDAIFAWGTPEAIGTRVKAHLDAGADHVCLQVVRHEDDRKGYPRQAWRDLAHLL